MQRRNIAIAVLLMVVTSWGTAQSAANDFGSIRKAADAYAAKVNTEFKLWRIDLLASAQGGPLQIIEGVFHYFRPLPDQDLDVLGVNVRILEGMYLPQVTQHAQYGSGSELVRILTRTGPPDWKFQKVKPTPVPPNLRSPEEILRRLQGINPGDDQARGEFFLSLIDVRYALPIREWAPDVLFKSSTRRNQSDGFFFLTAPEDRWVWWTIVEQDRPSPDRTRGASDGPVP